MLRRMGIWTGGLIFYLIFLLHPSQTYSWMVKHNDSVCLIMIFNASIEFDDYGLDKSTFIPLSALTDGSVCGNSFSIFHLEYEIDNDHEVTMSLLFNKTQGDWMMTKIEVELNNMNTSTNQVKSTGSDYEEFITPLGHYLECESHVQIEAVSLTFTEIETMQPFATSEDPGEDHECEADRGPDESNTGLIVGCVLAVMFIAVIACWVCNRVQSRRRQKYRYRHSPHYVN